MVKGTLTGIWGLALSAAWAAPALAQYRTAAHEKLSGDSGWDYLTADADAKRLYVTRDTSVKVVDLATRKELGSSIPTEGAHGVALAKDLGRGFVTSGRAGQVVAFDLGSLKVLGHIPAGKKPDAIVYQPTRKRVVAFNGESHTATVIDGERMTVAGTIDLGGKPEFAVSGPGDLVYVNIEDKGQLAVLDTAAMAVKSTWVLQGCEQPTGLAFDAAHHRLFPVCGNRKMLVVDSMTGTVVATVPIGDGPDAAAFDPATGLVFASNGDGTLTVVREESQDRFVVAGTVPTQKGARTMALDPATHRLYLVTADFVPAPPGVGKGHGHRKIVPGSVVLLELDPIGSGKGG
jgi:DNA-binding beta-propeller fold protein YncE